MELVTKKRMLLFAGRGHPELSAAAVRADRPRADHREAQLVAELPGLLVQVVEDLHVVGQEADRVDDDPVPPFLLHRPQHRDGLDPDHFSIENP